MSSVTAHYNIGYQKPVMGQASATIIQRATPRRNPSGMDTPANSLADDFQHVKTKTPGGKPISGAKHALGRLGLATHASPSLHTPGNTPNSVEALGRRIHSHLGLGSLSQQNTLADMTANRIVPSYERNFKLGLGNLEQHLVQAGADDRRLFPSTPPTPPNLGASPAFPRGGQSLIGGMSLGRARSSLAFPASYVDMPRLDIGREPVILESSVESARRATKVVPVRCTADAPEGRGENNPPSPKVEPSADSDLLF